MEYKKFDCNSYNIYTLKTDKFKTIRMEIIFNREVKKEELPVFSFLSDILTDCSKDFKRRKDIAIRLEELYKAVFYGNTSKTGNLLTISFVLDFINPSYIDEDDYLENVIQLPFQILSNPKVENAEFDITNFNIIKRRILESIESIKESSDRLAIINALTTMDKDSPTAYNILGTKEDLENITPSSLYKAYKELLNSSNCDIFVIGNTNMDEIVKLIKENFKNRVIKLNRPNILVNNSTRKKVLIKKEKSNFVQSTLVMIYNIKDLKPDIKNSAFHVFNYILGSGGITSKLYTKLRNDHSLCYGVKSMYMKQDNLLVIEVSLDNSNVPLAEKLIRKCIKEMQNGDYKDEDIEEAKRNLIVSLKMNLDNPVSLLYNYIFNIYDNLPLIEDRISLIKNVTREDLLNCAKSLLLNTIYIQESADCAGDKNEGN